MQHFILPIRCALVTVTLAAGVATAADVRTSISGKETYVGVPVVLRLEVSNATKFEPPTMPQVDGLEIHSRGAPARTTRIATVNGQTTKTTTETYAFEIVPTRAGRFRVPPITVEADGKRQTTTAIEFVASKSETGDLLFAEVAGKEQQIYVGQALDLKLNIWLRPFRDRERGLTLSPTDMWRMISPRSTWGAFSDEIERLANNRQVPPAKEVLRKDRSGVEHSYYQYEVEATFYPKLPGQIDADDLRVMVDYPTALGIARDPLASMLDDMALPGGFRSRFGDDAFRSPFGRRLAVQSVRPIVADVAVEPIEVRPIPTDNRPADYRGAVGQYQVVTQASPASVKAGDPIELLIGIAGTGPMELVQAPPLAELSKLTAEFRVPNQPLAGFVQDNRKVFTTTIRPRREGVDQIPPIPFTYFDPQQDRFVTVHSQPIPIQVAPADTLALDAIVGSRAASEVDRRAASELAPILVKNYTGQDLLRNETPRRLASGGLVALAALLPLVVLVVWATRNGTWLAQRVGRYGFASRRVQARILNATTAREVGQALQGHLARQLAVPAETEDPNEIVGGLRRGGHHQLAIRCERLFRGSGETRVGGPGQPLVLDELKKEALAVLSDLERRNHKRPRPTRWSPPPEGDHARAVAAKKSARIAGFLLLAVAASSASRLEAATDNQGTPLTTRQQAAVLSEATALYDRACAAEDAADAQQWYEDAAAKYQLLVDSGVTNSRLYVNLANAYLQCGKKGLALAHYRKALRIDPTNRTARVNLQYAQRSAGQASGKVADVGSTVDNWVGRYVTAQIAGGVAVAAWFVLWLAIGLRVLDVRFPWKSVAVGAAGVVVLSAVTYSHTFSRSRQDAVAIVISPFVELRESDGNHFPVVSGVALTEGQSVEVVKQRGNWLKVRGQADQAGWIPRNTVETI